MEATPGYCGVYRTKKEADAYIEECTVEHYNDGVGDGEFEEGGCYYGQTFEQFKKNFLQDMEYHIEVVNNIDPDQIIYINMDGNYYLRDLHRPLTNDKEEWKTLRKTNKEPTDTFYKQI